MFIWLCSTVTSRPTEIGDSPSHSPLKQNVETSIPTSAEDKPRDNFDLQMLGFPIQFMKPSSMQSIPYQDDQLLNPISEATENLGNEKPIQFSPESSRATEREKRSNYYHRPPYYPQMDYNNYGGAYYGGGNYGGYDDYGTVIDIQLY